MKKNVASQVIGAQMTSASDGSDFTGAVTCYVTGNGGTQAAGSVGSGACTHEGNGFHTYTPSQAETNYDHVAFTFKGSGAITASIQVYPSFPQTGDSFGLIGSTGSGLTSLASAANLSTLTSYVDTEVAAIKAKTDNLPASFPSNFASLSITAGGLVDITQAAADKAWGTTSRVLTAGTNIVLAKGTGITGFNDLDAAGAAAAVWNAAISSYGTSGSYGERVETYLDAQVSTVGGGSLTAADIADAVWDELLAAHAGGGSAGAALTGAGSAGDPWTTTLGGYGAGTAGKIIYDNLNATVSSRASQTSVDIVDDFLDTEIAAIKTKTDFLPSATAGASGGLFIAGANAATSVNLTGNITGNLSGSVGSVTGSVGSVSGAVGSVSGNVGGNVTGSVGSVTAGVTLAASAITAIWDKATSALTTVGSIGKRLVDYLTGDAYARLGAPAGASVSADIAAVKAETASIQTDTNDLQTRVPAALVGGRMDSNLSAISNSTTTMAAFNRAVKTNVIGTVGGGSTTTSVVSSSLTPAGSVIDQFKGLTLKFADDTTTAALRGQGTTITGSTASATPTFAVTALTTAPVATDTFAIF